MAIAPLAGSSAILPTGVARLARAGLDAHALVRALAERTRAAVPCSALMFLRTDPATALPTDGVVHALPEALCPRFWDNELLASDFNKFVDLARAEIPVATLSEATGGELGRSVRHREVYRGLAIGDELRAAFTGRDGSCWGIAQLLRPTGETFSPYERDLVASVATDIAEALREAYVTERETPAPEPGPALVVLDANGTLEAVTPGAEEWLAEIAKDSGSPMAPVPEPVYVVAGRARAARAGHGREPACAQVRTPSLGWLHLHASILQGAGPYGDSVAVMITPARGPDLAAVLALGYRLTHREQDVLRLLARGLTTAEITRELGISPHTVRDHVKALFGKVGVRSRAELVARVFAEHYFERLETDAGRGL
ncbi:MAG: LuxR family transcriptional regulator [Streptosporangiales bacterium]|nr:LuxR family transcriptional regulator [Streptosporangiales bacterium]